MGKIGVFRQPSFIDLRIHALSFDSSFQLFLSQYLLKGRLLFIPESPIFTSQIRTAFDVKGILDELNK